MLAESSNSLFSSLGPLCLCFFFDIYDKIRSRGGKAERSWKLQRLIIVIPTECSLTFRRPEKLPGQKNKCKIKREISDLIFFQILQAGPHLRWGGVCFERKYRVSHRSCGLLGSELLLWGRHTDCCIVSLCKSYWLVALLIRYQKHEMVKVSTSTRRSRTIMLCYSVFCRRTSQKWGKFATFFLLHFFRKCTPEHSDLDIGPLWCHKTHLRG